MAGYPAASARTGKRGNPRGAPLFRSRPPRGDFTSSRPRGRRGNLSRRPGPAGFAQRAGATSPLTRSALWLGFAGSGSRSGAGSACTVFALPLPYAAPRAVGVLASRVASTMGPPAPYRRPKNSLLFYQAAAGRAFRPPSRPIIAPPLLWGGAALLRRRGKRVVVKKRSWAEPVSGTGQPFHPLSLARWRRAICCATAQLSFYMSPPPARPSPPLSRRASVHRIPLQGPLG